MITLVRKACLSVEKVKAASLRAFVCKSTDTTAAGDTFNGGFVTALLEEKSFDEAIHFGQFSPLRLV